LRQGAKRHAFAAASALPGSGSGTSARILPGHIGLAILPRGDSIAAKPMTAQENPMNPKVDIFLRKAKKWQEESEELRRILLDCPLNEELKWGQPCYTYHEKNVVLIGGFKEYCTLLFFKGALLSDPKGILVTPGSLQAGRQIRFTGVRQITERENLLKTYIHEAIEVEQTGLKVILKKHSEYVIPEELQAKLDESLDLKTAFNALTPGRQRAYILHFSAPKQAKTRESRVEKCLQWILDGKGLLDK
jgi:uncharacterized protein YdeI (YjbR/CyaY-like superfamily)